MFKLIPSVVKGSWVIKQAVGNTPVLLGKKLTTRYYRQGHTCLLGLPVKLACRAA